MKSTISLMMICVPALLSGCAEKTEPVYQGPLLCDYRDDFRWSQAEFDARLQWPDNLRGELALNEAWKAECVD
uniref:Lipoprotein n=1 Tax=viral metagenome TaxID=1070528 RepID=A0A6M3JJD3_9ZZZZ